MNLLISRVGLTVRHWSIVQHFERRRPVYEHELVDARKAFLVQVGAQITNLLMARWRFYKLVKQKPR
jgi:hypothetical protein